MAPATTSTVSARRKPSWFSARTCVLKSPALNWQVQLAARKNDTRLIVANQRQLKLVKQAESFLQYRAGSEAYLAGALAKLLLEKGQADNDFLNRFVGNRDELGTYLKGLDLDAACAATGVETRTN